MEAHEYSIEKHDETNHWLECVCGSESSVEAHEYNEGAITVYATDESEGKKVYECVECGHEKEKVIPVIAGVLIHQYPQLSNADVVYYEGFIYTYGGNAAGRTNAIYRYDVENDKLYQLNAKLEIPSTSHRVVLVESKVYIFGGLGNSGARNYNILVHDLETQTISKLTDENGEEVLLPFGLNCHQVGYYNNVVYIVGGTSTNGNFSDVYAFSLETLELTKLDAALPNVVFKGAWCTVGKYVYVIGGTKGPRVDTIYRFDMEEHIVEEMNAKLPQGISQSRAIYDGEGNIYIYGGSVDDPKDALVDYIIKYNIESDTVEVLEEKLPLVLANVCVAKTEKGVFIFGGSYDMELYYNDYIDVIVLHDLVTGEVTCVRTPVKIDKES